MRLLFLIALVALFAYVAPSLPFSTIDHEKLAAVSPMLGYMMTLVVACCAARWSYDLIKKQDSEPLVSVAMTVFGALCVAAWIYFGGAFSDDSREFITALAAPIAVFAGVIAHWAQRWREADA